MGRTHLARAHGDPCSIEDGSHGGAVEPELASDVVHSLALLIRLYDLRLAVLVEMALELANANRIRILWLTHETGVR